MEGVRPVAFQGLIKDIGDKEKKNAQAGEKDSIGQWRKPGLEGWFFRGGSRAESFPEKKDPEGRDPVDKDHDLNQVGMRDLSPP